LTDRTERLTACLFEVGGLIFFVFRTIATLEASPEKLAFGDAAFIIPHDLLRRVHVLNFVRNFTVTSILFLLPCISSRPDTAGSGSGPSSRPFSGAAPGCFSHRLDQRPVLHGRHRPGRPPRGRPDLRRPGLDDEFSVSAASSSSARPTTLWTFPSKASITRTNGYRFRTANTILRLLDGIRPRAGHRAGGLLTRSPISGRFSCLRPIMLAIIGVVRRSTDSASIWSVSAITAGTSSAQDAVLRLSSFPRPALGRGGTFTPPFCRPLGLTISRPRCSCRRAVFPSVSALLIGGEVRCAGQQGLVLGHGPVRRGHDPDRDRKRLPLAGFRILHEIGDGAAGALIAVISLGCSRGAASGGAALLLAVEICQDVGDDLAPLGFRFGLQIPFYIPAASCGRFDLWCFSFQAAGI